MENINKYRIWRKDDSELARDKAHNNIASQIFDSSGITDMYYLGVIDTLSMLLQIEGNISKDDLLVILQTYQKNSKDYELSAELLKYIEKIIKINTEMKG